MNKGNILVVVAILVTVGLLSGFYLNSKGKINLPINTQTISENQNITSDKISLTANVDANGNVTGKTSPFAEVFINDQTVKADKDGNFSLKISLDEGENQVLVSANDSDGNVAEQNLTVNVTLQ